MLISDRRLNFDADSCVREIASFLSTQLRDSSRNGGFVVGLSGGVDSATTAALACRAVGAGRVFGLLLPERHSSPESIEYAEETAETLGISTEQIELTPVLESLGVYEGLRAALCEVDPDYRSSWPYRIVLPSDLRESRAWNVYHLELFPPDGEPRRHRLPAQILRRLQALTNVKLRLRMTLLYREAESRGYLVAGTTNRCELDQGFFVQYGDGGVDLEPIAHLYKSQVRQLALHFGLSERIALRPATPDTWGADVTDDEFFFRLPYELVDSLLVREDLGLDDQTIATELDLDVDQIVRLRAELARRRKVSAAMRCIPPCLPTNTLEEVN